ncbi:endoplasmic reticulum-Golgi intermediate compartment protein 3 isoform X2 [Lycorma delicatula]|uniref:endoplasmic reticulum-Golgi intermediate compartment protein 3 isoform X2 n=1 Tax=Lycorma delicatula TaxID=130591 RepID=UPI003F513E31
MNFFKKLQPGIEKLRELDAYSKPIEDFRVKTVSGGTVSVCCWCIIICLVCLRFYEHLFVQETVETIFVDTSRGPKLKINIDFVMPNISCDYLAVDAMDSSGEQHLQIDHNIYKRRLDINGHPIEEPQKENIGTKVIKPEDLATESSNVAEEKKCGSCYGAENEALNITCCNTCEEVKEAYRKKKWVQPDLESIEQCKGLHDPEKIKNAFNEGCHIYGYMEVNRVGGSFHVAPGQSFTVNHVHVHDVQPFSSASFNTTHRIRHLSFGDHKVVGKSNPLDETESVAEEGNFAVAYVSFNHSLGVTISYYVNRNPHLKICS